MNRYKIIEADIRKDKETIISLLKADNRTISSEIYDWKYFNYPYESPRVWFIVHTKTKKIVGSGSAFPRIISVKGKLIPVITTADLVVDVKHRSLFPAIKLEQEIIKQLKKTNYSFIYSYINKNSKPVFDKIGYKEIGDFRQYVKLLKISNLPNKYIPNYLNFKLTKIIIDLFLSLFSKELYYNNKSNYNIELLEVFDKRFDYFYNTIIKQYNIIGDRRENFLTWRYIKKPGCDHKIFCITNNKDILGYIVYTKKDNTYYINDFVCISDNINTLISEFMLFARKNKISAVEFRYMGDNNFIREIKKYLFISFKKKDKGIYIFFNNYFNNINLSNNSNWHFFSHDKNV